MNSPDPDPSPGPRQRLAKAAVAAVAAGVLVAAVALAWRPVSSAVALERGRAAAARHDDRGAADLFAAASARDPGNPLLAFEAVRAARRAGDFEEDPAALDAALTRAARLGADPEDVRRERVLAAAAAGQLDGPDGVLRELPALLADDRGDLPAVCEAYVRGFCVNRRFRETWNLLNGWEQAAPDDPEVPYRRGAISASLESNDAAVEYFRAALAIDPLHAGAASSLAFFLRGGDAGERAEAVELLAPVAAARPDDPDVLTEYGLALQTVGDLGAASGALRRAVELDPDDLDRRRPLAETLLRAGDPAGALAAIEPLTAVWPGDRRAAVVRGGALRKLGRTEEAAEAFRTVTALEAAAGGLQNELRRLNQSDRNTHTADDYYEVGRLILEHENRLQGAGYLTAAVQMDPRHGPAHAALARYLEAVGRAEQARRHRRSAARYGVPEDSPPAPSAGR